MFEIPSLKELKIEFETSVDYEINLENSTQLETLSLVRETYPLSEVTLILTNPKLRTIELFGKIELTNIKDILLQFQNLERFSLQGPSISRAHSYLEFVTPNLKQLRVSKLLHLDLPFLSSLQSLELTQQYMSEIEVHDLPSLQEFKILSILAKVILSSLKSLTSIIFSQNMA